MRVDLKLRLYVDDCSLPAIYKDADHFKDVLRENVKDVFVGSDIPIAEVEYLIIDVEDAD